MEEQAAPIPDVSAAYHLWDDLYSSGLRLALSTSSDTPQERKAAWERLVRGHLLSLKERDAMWVRLLERTGSGAHGR